MLSLNAGKQGKQVIPIRKKAKRIVAMIAALLLSCSILCTTAFAAPATDDSSADTSVSDTAGVADDQQTQNEDDEPFGRSYMIKGIVVVGIGVVFYVALVIKTKKK